MKKISRSVLSVLALGLVILSAPTKEAQVVDSVEWFVAAGGSCTALFWLNFEACTSPPCTTNPYTMDGTKEFSVGDTTGAHDQGTPRFIAPVGSPAAGTGAAMLEMATREDIDFTISSNNICPVDGSISFYVQHVTDSATTNPEIFRCDGTSHDIFCYAYGSGVSHRVRCSLTDGTNTTTVTTPTNSFDLADDGIFVTLVYATSPSAGSDWAEIYTDGVLSESKTSQTLATLTDFTLLHVGNFPPTHSGTMYIDNLMIYDDNTLDTEPWDEFDAGRYDYDDCLL